MKTVMACGVSALIGAVLALGVYRHYVPLPHDAIMRADAFEPENRDWFFQNASEVFPTRTVARAETAQALPMRQTALEGFSFEHNGRQYTISDMYAEAQMAGLVVLHKGEIVHESYGRGADAGTQFTTFSLVKSFTSTLVGFCVGEGLIKSVDDPLSTYLPELAGTAYDGVTIKQALQMSSGVRYDIASGANVGTDTVDFITDSMITGKKRAYDIAISFPRVAEPGTKFIYNTAESQVLLELVRRVSGMSAAKYMEIKLWRPLGMEHDAGWILDNPGEDGAEMGGAFFNASLRDWARFGQFMEQNGVWNGQRLLPEDWVARATVTDQPHLMHGKVHPGSNRGYGWHWWTYPNGAFTASGANGQTVYVDDAHDLVVARASAWPKGWVQEADDLSFSFFTGLAKWSQMQNETASLIEAAE